MSQHDYTIDNNTATNVRSDINLALKALASNSSGAAAPTTTYANMFWYDTTNDYLKIRNEANTAWITVGQIDQTDNSFNPVVGAFTIKRVSATKVGFYVSGVSKMSLDSSGNLVTTGNITAYGTP